MRADLAPHGSAIINTVQQLAGAAGIAMMFSVMGLISSRALAEGGGVGRAMAQGAQQAFQVGSLMVIVALILIVLFIPRKLAALSETLPAH